MVQFFSDRRENFVGKRSKSWLSALSALTLMFYYKRLFSHCMVKGLTSIQTTPSPCGSVGSVQNMRIGGHWFNPRLGQYSFQRLMIVTATGFISLSPLPIVSTMVIWESSQWLWKNIVQSTGKKKNLS